VTRRVGEKIVQNVAQPVFLSKLMHHLNRVRKQNTKTWSTTVNLLEPAKENKRPITENSPNLVALNPAAQALFFLIRLFLHLGFLSLYFNGSVCHALTD
jgi:hypothetical protein